MCEIISAITGVDKHTVFKYQRMLRAANQFHAGVIKDQFTQVLDAIQNNKMIPMFGVTSIPEVAAPEIGSTTIETLAQRIQKPRKKRKSPAPKVVQAEPRSAQKDISACIWFVKTVGGMERAKKVFEAVSVKLTNDEKIAALRQEGEQSMLELLGQP